MKLPVSDLRLPPELNRLILKLQDLFSRTNQQVNQLTEGQATAVHNAMSSMPTAGTYKSGDFVRKTTYAEAGGAGNKYVVTGWNRLTNGSAHVLNTDWVEARVLTGN